MYFDNSGKSLKVLNWWRERCLEWCYNRIEDGKFGDQKYLDDWTNRFDCVWELQNLGGGLAPWNIQQYRMESPAFGIEIKTGKHFTPVFYHFHGLKFYTNGKVVYAPNTYRISERIKKVFYKKYLEKLEQSRQYIQQFNDTFDPHGSRPASFYFKERYVKGKLNYIVSNFVKRLIS
jgi:hypothetical protein